MGCAGLTREMAPKPARPSSNASGSGGLAMLVQRQLKGLFFGPERTEKGERAEKDQQEGCIATSFQWGEISQVGGLGWGEQSP